MSDDETSSASIVEAETLQAAAGIPPAFDRCVQCGYTLSGLTQPCFCPECGKTNDRRRAVLFCDVFWSASLPKVNLRSVFLISILTAVVAKSYATSSHYWLVAATLAVLLLLRRMYKIWRNPALNRWVVVLSRAGILLTTLADLEMGQPLPWSDVRAYSVRRGKLGGIVLNVKTKTGSLVSLKFDLAEAQIAELREVIAVFVDRRKRMQPHA